MSLFGRCNHQWVEAHRDVQRRSDEFEFGGGLWTTANDDAMRGCTYIELRCKLCGDVNQRKIQGEHP